MTDEVAYQAQLYFGGGVGGGGVGVVTGEEVIELNFAHPDRGKQVFANGALQQNIFCLLKKKDVYLPAKVTPLAI